MTETTAKGMMNLGDYGKMIEPQTTKLPSLKSRKLAKKIFDECVGVSFGYEELTFDANAAARLIDEVLNAR